MQSTYMLTLRPLRSTIIGLGLFAAATSAQAQLLITFLEDTEKGHLSVIFSGQDAAPFDVNQAINLNSYSWLVNNVFTMNGNSATVFGTPFEPWTSNSWGIIPLPGAPIFREGTGGFQSTGGALALLSTTSAEAGQQMSWDGIITYWGNLAAIGLEEGDSGTLVFTKDDQTFEIHWDTAVVVPEPTTYALALGLGVAGVALLRRRARR